jgi:hypothetical protein
MTTPKFDGRRGTLVRGVTEIKRQLSELAQVLQKAEKYGERDPASSSRLKSLRKHQSQLNAELNASELLESDNDAVFALDGDPVDRHSVQAKFLGSFLAKVQELVNAIAQVRTSVPTNRSSVPRNIITENRLMVTGFAPSSFAVKLRLAKREEPDLFGEIPSQDTLNTLAELVRGDALPASLAAFAKHARVRKHYSELLEMVAKSGANIRISTKSAPYGVRLTTSEARNRAELLDTLLSDVNDVDFTGELVGGSIERDRFELKANDEIIQGRVSGTAREQLKSLTFGCRVHAELIVETQMAEDGGGEPKSTYFLTKVVPIQEAAPEVGGPKA